MTDDKRRSLMLKLLESLPIRSVLDVILDIARSGRPLSDREEQAAEVLRRATARDPEARAALNVLLDGIVLGDREVTP